MSGGGVLGQSHQLLLQDVLPWLSTSKQLQRNATASAAATPTAATVTTKTTTTTLMPTPTTQHIRPCTILVQDTLETSGRFLLFLTSKEEAASSKRILWLSCTPTHNARLIRQGLSKLGGVVGSNPNTIQAITIRDVVQEMSRSILDLDEEEEVREFDAESFVRMLYASIVVWFQNDVNKKEAPPPAWIVLDDVSALATLVGSRLAYALTFQLRALQEKANKGTAMMTPVLSLIISCAGDDQRNSSHNNQVTGDDSSDCYWVGAGGGLSLRQELQKPSWECGLVELVDLVVDVIPLTTGMSRGVHGRIVLTPTTATASSSSSWSANYCLGENQIWATRVSPTGLSLY